MVPGGPPYGTGSCAQRVAERSASAAPRPASPRPGLDARPARRCCRRFCSLPGPVVVPFVPGEARPRLRATPVPRPCCGLAPLPCGPAGSAVSRPAVRRCPACPGADPGCPALAAGPVPSRLVSPAGRLTRLPGRLLSCCCSPSARLVVGRCAGRSRPCAWPGTRPVPSRPVSPAACSALACSGRACRAGAAAAALGSGASGPRRLRLVRSSCPRARSSAVLPPSRPAGAAGSCCRIAWSCAAVLGPAAAP